MVKPGEKIDRLRIVEDSGQRKDRSIVWKCQCDCGNICYKTSKQIQKMTVKSCGCATSKKKNLIGKKFGLLTVIDYTNENRHGSALWKCQCDCGNITYATTEGLRTGDNISCGCRNLAREAFAKRYKVDFTGNKFGKLLVLGATESRTPSGNQIWKCQCDCGNICYVSTNHLQTGNTKSCGCLQNHSWGEIKIRELLDQHNIRYKAEYTFPELPNRRYDFALLDDRDNVIQLIEFDGEQHYFETQFFHTTLSEQQKIDKEKTEFAQSKQIPLTRIPYWKRNTLCFEDLEVGLNELPFK